MNLDGSSTNWQKPLGRENKQPTDSEGYKRNPSRFSVKWLVLPARWIRTIKGDKWKWFPKHWAIVGPTVKSHLVTARYILHPMTSISVSPQVPIALLLLSYYQNQYSSAAENLVGYMLSHSQTKRKCKLNTEMPQIGDLGKISTPGLCLLLPFLSLALGIKVTHKRNRRGSFASEKNHSLGDFLSNVLLWKVSDL